jgi:hypothetical protein
MSVSYNGGVTRFRDGRKDCGEGPKRMESVVDEVAVVVCGGGNKNRPKSATFGDDFAAGKFHSDA